VLEVAQASVALAQAELVRMRIVAPFDGVVGIRVINVGDYVKDGSDLLSIDDTGAMLVDFRLPERVLSRLKAGQVVDVALDGLPGRSFKARVDAFDSQLDANGRSLLVRASLGNADGLLKPGMFARARLVFALRENAVVVPEEALVPVGSKRYLFKVVDGADGRKTTQRIEAQVGLRVLGKVEILSGLTHADMIVTAGQPRLMQTPDAVIRVVELGASPRPAASAPVPASGPGPAAGLVSGARPVASLSSVRYP
jgi:membrane fusion protein (multidrug efflux system)